MPIDASGMFVLGNRYNAQLVDSEAAVLTSNINGLVQGVYVSVYGAAPLSLPTPHPSAVSINPPSVSQSLQRRTNRFFGRDQRRQQLAAIVPMSNTLPPKFAMMPRKRLEIAELVLIAPDVLVNSDVEIRVPDHRC
jgi:hypothetical protein